MVVVGASMFASCSAFAGARRVESRNSSPTICSATTPSTSSCPTVVAVARSNTRRYQVAKFLEGLWGANRGGANPILGRYALQRCSNSGPSPYQVTCVLWSSASRHNSTLLSDVLTSSRLFQLINITSFERSTLTSQEEMQIYACAQLSVPPNPGPVAWEAIAVPESTLSALSRSGNSSLGSAGRDYVAASRKESFDAQRRALAQGVAACHRLGLRTAMPS